MICAIAYFNANTSLVVFSKTVKAVEEPILVHYLTQQVLQMDKFWENSKSNSAKSMHCPPFLA